MFHPTVPSRGRVVLSALLVGLFLGTTALGQGGSTALIAPDTIVGAIEVDAPSVSPFLLRATLPVPAGTILGSSTLSPLVLLDANNQPVDTQIEVVTRHSTPGSGAAVIELLARMDAPVGATGKLKFSVQHKETPRLVAPQNPTVADFLAAPKGLPAQVKSLLNTKGNILLAAKDVFGNIYLIDLVHDKSYDNGARETKRFGSVQAEFRHHGLLKPLVEVGGSEGTLSHLFGVHAYFRVTAGDPVVELDLRIHNGADGSAEDNEAMDALYFQKLVLLVPEPWAAQQRHENPSLGTPSTFGPFTMLPLVEARTDGKPHFMPQQAQMHRRIVLSPKPQKKRAESHLNGEGLGFSVPGPGPINNPDYWSWWNPQTPNYFPQMHMLPRLEQVEEQNLASDLKQEFETLSAYMTDGSGEGIYPVISGELGWAHPFGVAYGGMTGGDGINLFWGVRTLVASSIKGYQRLELLHRMNTDRMPNALYKKDGTPSSIEDWLSATATEDYVPFFFYMKPSGSDDPFGFKTAPSFQVDYVKANALEPDYEATLESYKILDIQHLVRYTGPAKTLAWIGNDSIAKDDIRLQAEMFHLTYHEYENSAYHHVQGTGMLADIKAVEANPAAGFPFGRGEGWGMDAMTSAYLFADEDWRMRKLPWFAQIVDLVSAGQASCTGFIQSTVYEKMLGGQFRVRQVIESSIVENALRAVRRSVLKGQDPVRFAVLRDVLVASLKAMIRPESWDPGLPAPYSQLAVAPKDESLPPYCGPPPAGGQSAFTDAYQQWSSLAYGLEMTGDKAFLTHAQKMLELPLSELLNDETLKNLGNRAALNALMEFLLSKP